VHNKNVELGMYVSLVTNDLYKITFVYSLYISLIVM
jgi:hypothetical protein